jgi:hypothetical protein
VRRSGLSRGGPHGLAIGRLIFGHWHLPHVGTGERTSPQLLRRQGRRRRTVGRWRRRIVSGRRRRVDDRRSVDDRWTGHRSADECTGDDAGTNGTPPGTAPATAAAPARTAAPTGTAAPARTAAPTPDGQDVARRRVL